MDGIQESPATGAAASLRTDIARGDVGSTVPLDGAGIDRANATANTSKQSQPEVTWPMQPEQSEDIKEGGTENLQPLGNHPEMLASHSRKD